MKRIKLLLLSAFVCFGLSNAVAQTKVTGNVTSSDDGMPIPGVTIIVKGMSNVGTSTNIDGNFTLNVPAAGKTLIISYIGYQSQEVPVSGSPLKVVLVPESKKLDEVVVTALGIARDKKSMGAAVQEVKADALTRAGQSNVVSSLAGKVAGVQISSAGGQIGASSRITIRGNASLNSYQPLYVVDGVPISSDQGKSTSSNQQVDFGNGLGDINPDDIESITVLKGGSAALYGMRAGNGVIVITTKSGKGKKGIQLQYDGNYNFDQVRNLTPMQNKYGQGYLGDEWTYKQAVADGYAGSYQQFAVGGYDSGYGFSYVDGFAHGVNDGTDESWGPRLDIGLKIPQYSSPVVNGVRQATDWISHPNNIKDFFRTGYSTSHNISMTSTTENSNTRISFGYKNQEGVIPNTNLIHYTGAVNSTLSLNKVVELNFAMNYTRTESDNLPMTEYGSNNPMQSMGQWFGRQVDMLDLKANWDKNGANGMPYNWNSNYHNNPFWTMRNTNALNKNRVFGKSSLVIKPTSYLRFEGRLGIDTWNSQTKLITRSRSNETLLGFNSFTGGQFYLNTYNNTDVNGDFIATFDKKYGDIGVTVLAGANYRNLRYNYNQIGADELTVPNLFTISNVNGSPVTSMSNSWIRSNSIYSNATLSYKTWVYFDASYRTDWSSTIKKEITYPSFSVSLLPFEIFKGPDWLSYFKIRGNIAKLGNATSAYQTDPYYYASASTIFGVTQYSATTQYPPLNLKPEMVKTKEVGVEARFLNNRIGFDVAYYSKNTSDQILAVTLSKATGYNSMLINAGLIQNRGWEVQLTGVPVDQKDGLKWDVSINWSRDRSKVKELYPGLTTYTLGSQWSTYVQAIVGQPWGEIIGTGMKRDANGNIIVKSNGLPSTVASQVLGNVNPDWLASISNEFSYKGISLGFLLDYRKGGDVFSVSQMFGTYSGLLKYTAQDDFRENGLVLGKDFLTNYHFVKADGSTNDIRVGAQDFFESYYSNRELSVFDGSFLKLREVHVSYDIPKRFLNKIGLINRATVSFVGTNVALLWLSSDNLAKIDPESTVSAGNNGVGLETTSAPQTRSLGFKLSLGF